MDGVETAKYLITGLVDFSDEQGNIRGQYPIGSVQELPVSVGIVAVEDGRAEAVGEEEGTEGIDASPEDVEETEEEAGIPEEEDLIEEVLEDEPAGDSEGEDEVL